MTRIILMWYQLLSSKKICQQERDVRISCSLHQVLHTYPWLHRKISLYCLKSIHKPFIIIFKPQVTVRNLCCWIWSRSNKQRNNKSYVEGIQHESCPMICFHFFMFSVIRVCKCWTSWPVSEWQTLLPPASIPTNRISISEVSFGPSHSVQPTEHCSVTVFRVPSSNGRKVFKKKRTCPRRIRNCSIQGDK
jgi:hypothetical protein